MIRQIKIKPPILIIMILSGLLTACSFAPTYQKPWLTIPPHYKEMGSWEKVEFPVSLNQPWWTLFHDKTLNILEQKVTCDNQNLKVAVTQYQKARALAQAVQSEQYPTIIGQSIFSRQQNSASSNTNHSSQLLYNTFLIGTNLNYEIDAWGRVRNSVLASNHLSNASEFDLVAISLSLHAELATDYFQLRGFDESQRILDATVIAYKKALYLTQQRHKGGIAAAMDVDQAVTQLENAKTLATDMQLQRAKLEHAIAVLIGEVPEKFTLKATYTPKHSVVINPHLPSQLLRHRPDIAASEQRVQAANATIGIARAAFFPEFNLITLLGLQSNQLKNLFSAPSLFWSLGPGSVLSLTQPEISQVLFDGYKLQAQLIHAKASYFQTVSQYRQTVLTAFQEVENALVTNRRLQEENQTQMLSTRAAKQALFQANQLYKEGVTTFLNVVIAENQALQSELALVTIQTHLQTSHIDLIQALGGGWGYCQVQTEPRTALINLVKP